MSFHCCNSNSLVVLDGNLNPQPSVLPYQLGQEYDLVLRTTAPPERRESVALEITIDGATYHCGWIKWKEDKSLRYWLRLGRTATCIPFQFGLDKRYPKKPPRHRPDTIIRRRTLRRIGLVTWKLTEKVVDEEYLRVKREISRQRIQQRLQKRAIALGRIEPREPEFSMEERLEKERKDWKERELSREVSRERIRKRIAYARLAGLLS